MAYTNGALERTPPRTIYILAYDDCDSLDVTGPYEVLQQAAQMLPQAQPLDVQIRSVRDSTATVGMARANNGLTFVTAPWDGSDPPDLLIVAGGNFQVVDGIPVGTGIGKQKDNPYFQDVINQQHGLGRTVVSVCTAAIGVVAAGIAENRHMTTHPGILDLLTGYAKSINKPVILIDPDFGARVVDAGDIISCGGVSAGISEAFYLLQAFWPQMPELEGNVRAFIDFPYHSPIKVLPS